MSHELRTRAAGTFNDAQQRVLRGVSRAVAGDPYRFVRHYAVIPCTRPSL
jgi:hypothetical protein